MQRVRQGFSLLEMSVVIALMGLVAGVILVSQGISRRNEMRTVLVDANNYTMAVQQFQLKYNAVPGDFVDASKVWGALASCPTDSGKGKNKTCDGNGNGRINGGELVADGFPVDEYTLCEQYRFWQHLALGGFIQGDFSGVSGLKDISNNPICGASATTSFNSVPTVNVPEGPVKGSGFSVNSMGYFDSAAGASSADWYDGDYTNALLFGGVLTGNSTVGPILKTDAAKELDAKVDDGFASTGKIRAPRAAYANAPNCSIDASGAYREVNRSVACMLVFMNDYNKATHY